MKSALNQIKSAQTNANNLMNDPKAFMMANMKILGPLVVVAMLPEIIDGVIKFLTMPGMPLDPRFKRLLDEEWNSGMERQRQFNTFIGARNVTAQTSAGWRNMMGAGHRSVFRDVAQGTGLGPRTGVMNIADKSLGGDGVAK